MHKSIMIAAVTAIISIGSAFADRCEVKINLYTEFSENRYGFSRIANLGDILSKIERRTNTNITRAEVLGLTLNITQRSPNMFAAWQDVSGYNQNSGAPAYGDRRGDHIIDNGHWANMLVSNFRPGATVLPGHIDIIATGAGTVNSATVYLQANRRVCDELQYQRFERRDDRQAFGIFNIDLSVDRSMTLKIDRNGVTVVNTDGDYRTGLQNNPNMSSQFSLNNLRGVSVTPLTFSRVLYTYQIVPDGRNSSYVLINFTHPANGAGNGSFTITLQ